MDPPPPPPAPASTAAAPPPPPSTQLGYPESVESSPRSRNTDSWDEQLAPGGGGGKLRLMCSYGGHIVPRPHDKTLCYVGGDTRIVVVERHSSLAELATRLSKTLLGGRSFSLKYQLPNEDLDSLISVTTDEDVENMIDEYDRTSSSSVSGSSHKPSRLRLFLFPSKPDSASSIGSLLDNSTKSEDWFLNALNGSGVISRGVSESQSVNCLLGLDDDGAAASAAVSEGLGSAREVEAQVKTGGGKQGQDVHSVPDSPMLETTSSFGSTSSSPSMVNLPPIRVHVVEDGGARLQDQKVGLEEQFSQMGVAPNAVQKQEEGFVVLSSPPPPHPSTLVAAAVPAMPVASGAVAGEYANRVVSDDERSDQGVPVGYRKPPQPQPQPQTQPQLAQLHTHMQQKSNGGGGIDLPSPDSVSSDGSLTNAMSRPKPTIYQDPVSGQLHSVPGGNRVAVANHIDPKMNIYDPTSRAPYMHQVQDPPGYILSSQYDQQQQQRQQHQHQQQQQPQQVIHGAHYIQQQPNGGFQFYPVYPSQQQQHHHQALDQSYPMYFVPARPAQAYNLSMQQSNMSESTVSTNPSGVPQAASNPSIVNPAAYNQTRSAAPPKAEAATGMYRTATPGASPMVQVSSNQQHPQQYMGYSQFHHASQSIAPNSNGTANYAYEYADPGAQIYYSQAMAPPLPAQYQTMTTAPTAVMSETASHLQADGVKQQTRSQP